MENFKYEKRYKQIYTNVESQIKNRRVDGVDKSLFYQFSTTDVLRKQKHRLPKYPRHYLIFPFVLTSKNVMRTEDVSKVGRCGVDCLRTSNKVSIDYISLYLYEGFVIRDSFVTFPSVFYFMFLRKHLLLHTFI